MTSTSFYFCGHCEEVKEEKFFRKCEDCKEMAKHDEIEGAYYCNISDGDTFSYKNKKILCYPCKHKPDVPETKVIKITKSDTLQDKVEKRLKGYLESCESSNKYLENELNNKQEQLDNYKLDKKVAEYMFNCISENGMDSTLILNSPFGYACDSMAQKRIDEIEIDMKCVSTRIKTNNDHIKMYKKALKELHNSDYFD